jgi:hypothetical protein
VRPLRVAAALAWLALIVETAFLAPPTPENTWAMVKDLFVFDGPDPLITAAFQMMGVWPFLYARILLRGVHAQRPTPWIFVIASFGIGAFALLPALVLRRFGAPTTRDPGWLRAFTEKAWVGQLLAGVAFVLLGWGVFAGDVDVALELWRTNGFVHTFGLDFLTVSLAYPAVVATERAAGETSNG